MYKLVLTIVFISVINLFNAQSNVSNQQLEDMLNGKKTTQVAQAPQGDIQLSGQQLVDLLNGKKVNVNNSTSSDDPTSAFGPCDITRQGHYMVLRSFEDKRYRCLKNKWVLQK